MCVLDFNFPNAFGNVRRTAVGQVVAVDGGEHNIVETPRRDRRGRVLRFVAIERRWGARRFDRAKAAATSAGVAHQLGNGRNSAICYNLNCYMFFFTKTNNPEFYTNKPANNLRVWFLIAIYTQSLLV